MWYMNIGTGFFRFVIIHVFDRRTDGRTFCSWLRPPCIGAAR